MEVFNNYKKFLQTYGILLECVKPNEVLLPVCNKKGFCVRVSVRHNSDQSATVVLTETGLSGASVNFRALRFCEKLSLFRYHGEGRFSVVVDCTSSLGLVLEVGSTVKKFIGGLEDLKMNLKKFDDYLAGSQFKFKPKKCLILVDRPEFVQRFREDPPEYFFDTYVCIYVENNFIGVNCIYYAKPEISALEVIDPRSFNSDLRNVLENFYQKCSALKIL